MSLETILAEAMEKHRSGDLDSAKALYKSILAITPDDPDVLNLLGVLNLQCNNLEDAGELIRNAIIIDPTTAEYHYNFGQVLRHTGDNDAAMASYRKALEINPELQIAKDQLASMKGESTVVPVPSFEPLKRYEVIQAVIDRIRAKVYLEIGIDSGKSFVNVSADRKFGVDPVSTDSLINRLLTNCRVGYFKFASTGPDVIEITLNATNRLSEDMPVNNHSEFFYTTSDQFFLQHAPVLFKDTPIDVAFIDGLHTYHQTYTDVSNVLDFLSKGGIVLVHDCNPPTEASAFPALSWEQASTMNIPGWNGLWCGDVWKTIVRFRATRDDLRAFVLDCDFGIGVLYFGEPEGMLDISVAEIEHMTYADLKKNRKALINLKPQAYLHEFLRNL